MSLKVLITAGPTREPIDPVRYLSNRSSGKMGYAMAEAFVHAGHRVLLVSGPTHLDVPNGVDFIQITTASEMYDAVKSYLPQQDIAIFSAAVADFTPKSPTLHKIKKQADSETMTLELIKTPDILGSARSLFGFAGTLIGFAAETENLEEYARTKLISKACNLIIANDVSRPEIGFDSNDNQVTLIDHFGSETLPLSSKSELAHTLTERIISLHREQ